MKKTAKYLGAAAAILLLYMCKKDKPETENTDPTTAFVHAWMEQASSDICLMGIQASDNDTGGLFNTCAAIITQNADTANTDTLTVDYGASACLCGDGKTRSGKLQFMYNGGKIYKDSAVTINCQLLNYTVDGNGISGTMTIANKGRNSSGNLYWTTNETLTLNKVSPVGIVTWNAVKTVEILNTSAVFTGYANAITWSQARISVSGSTSGVADDGKNYTATITIPLEKNLSCAPLASTPRRHPFQQGSINFHPVEKTASVIDYGIGACDAIATIALDDITYSFGP